MILIRDGFVLVRDGFVATEACRSACCDTPAGFVSARTCAGTICGVEIGEVEVWISAASVCSDTGAAIYQPGVPRTFGMGGLCWSVDQPQLPTALEDLPPDAILIADEVEKRCQLDGRTPQCGSIECLVPWAYLVMRPCQCEDDDAPGEPRVLACPALVVEAWSRGECFTVSAISPNNTDFLRKCRTARELWVGVPQPGDIVLDGDNTPSYARHLNCCACCAARPGSPCEWTDGPLPPLSQPDPPPPPATDLCAVNVSSHGIAVGVCCNPLTAVGQATAEAERGASNARERRTYAATKQLGEAFWRVRVETFLPGLPDPIVEEYTKPFLCDCRLYFSPLGKVCEVAEAFDSNIWEGDSNRVTIGAATVTPTTIEVETESVPLPNDQPNYLPATTRFSLTQQVTETDCGPNECVDNPPPPETPTTAPVGPIEGPPGALARLMGPG